MTYAERRLAQLERELNQLIEKNKARYQRHRTGDNQFDFAELEHRISKWKDEVKAEKEASEKMEINN